MNGPNLISTNSNSNSSSNNNSTNLSFILSKGVIKNKSDNKLIQVFFGGQSRPILSIINSSLSSNTIKLYKYINTSIYVLIKIEGSKLYRMTGAELICIPINNIDIKLQLVCSYKNLNELEVKELYKEYKVR